MGSKTEHPSGRVIAVGRLLLASLFLVAILVDFSQPVRAPAATYALLALYVVLAAAIVAATWNNWWLDSRLAGPAHAFDIMLFSALVLLTAGYTSPFFTFFIFLMLSAAIRWGWRETALTAILLTLLFLLIGIMFGPTGTPFELNRFIIRTGHLVILSLILIWFGINQWSGVGQADREDPLAYASLDQSPLESGLRAAMTRVRARAGSFVWTAQEQTSAATMRDGRLTVVDAPGFAINVATRPFVYDLKQGRGLVRDKDRNLLALSPDKLLDADTASSLQLREGIAIPVRSGAGEGMLYLEGVPNLSVDHLDRAETISAGVAAHLQRHALLRAAEKNAEAGSRLTLARDLHDSVVQFLAGAAFRIEALKRAVAAGRPIKADLNELQQLMLQEQVELRSFISALRGSPRVAFEELAGDLQALAQRLCRQWGVECKFATSSVDLTVPARLKLDTQYLVREAVANAVRHAGAKSIDIALSATPEAIGLVLINDGTRYPRKGKTVEMPQSLKERVEQASGTLDVSRGMDVTRLTISLPVGGRPLCPGSWSPTIIR